MDEHISLYPTAGAFHSCYCCTTALLSTTSTTLQCRAMLRLSHSLFCCEKVDDSGAIVCRWFGRFPSTSTFHCPSSPLEKTKQKKTNKQKQQHIEKPAKQDDQHFFPKQSRIAPRPPLRLRSTEADPESHRPEDSESSSAPECTGGLRALPAGRFALEV